MYEDYEDYIAHYSKDLTRLCISLCGNVGDADDLFQETWYKAIKNFSKYKKDKPFDKWLFAICVNTYKDNLRLSYNKKRYLFKTEEEEKSFLNSVTYGEHEQAEEYLQLHRAIATLSKKLRITLTLFYFRDYTVKEISEILNIPEGTVKSRLNTARRIIKRRLENGK